VRGKSRFIIFVSALERVKMDVLVAEVNKKTPIPREWCQLNIEENKNLMRHE
jgi:hypothetical protein